MLMASFSLFLTASLPCSQINMLTILSQTTAYAGAGMLAARTAVQPAAAAVQVRLRQHTTRLEQPPSAAGARCGRPGGARRFRADLGAGPWPRSRRCP